MTIPNAVTWPPVRAATPNLLTLAAPLPAGWERGITWTAGDGCAVPFVVGECPTGDDLKQAADDAATVTFVPVTVGAAVACTASGGGPGDRAWGILDATVADALYQELLTGAVSARDAAGATGNPAIAGSVTHDFGDLGSVVDAFACVEQFAAGASSGRELWLHTSVHGLTLAKDAGIVWRDGTRWRTAYGSTVVATAGLDSVTVGLVTTVAVIATLPVAASVGRRDVMDDLDRATNTATSRVEEIGMAAFDPCLVVVAGTGVDSCGQPAPLVVPTSEPDPDPVPDPCDSRPNTNTRKDDVVAWLVDAGVSFSGQAPGQFTVPELLAIVDAYCNDDKAAAQAMADVAVGQA